MKIANANEVFQHAITGGSEHCWQCWPNARFLDYENEHATGSVVHSTANGTIYEATVCWKDERREGGPYRWMNPQWRGAHDAESADRGVDHTIAWDSVRWIDCEVWDDWADKAAAIWRGETPDQRISVPVEIEDSVLVQLALEAHRQDITLNALINKILEAEIDAAGMLADAPAKTADDIEHSKYWYDTDRNR